MSEVNTLPPYAANPSEPSLADVLALTKKELMLGMSVHHIGTIRSFNSADQTANVTINYKKTFYSRANTGQYVPKLVDYPQLVNCPVVILAGGLGAFTAPIDEGDECLVLFNDRDMNNWFQGNANAGPNTPRLHSFSDALILVGVRSLAHSLANYDEVRICMRTRAGATVVGVNPSNNKILLSNSAPTNSTTLRTILNTMIGHLQSLSSACAAITVTVAAAPGVSTVPINAATFTGLSTSLGNDATALAALLE